MTFFQSINTCLRKYATFSGRATRSEFWWWQLFCLAVLVLPFCVGVLAGIAYPAAVEWAAWIIYAVYAAILIPDFAITSRRFHDIGRSGWWQVLLFVPIVGWVLFVWWGVKQSDLGPNRFGPSPLPSSTPLDASFVDQAGA